MGFTTVAFIVQFCYRKFPVLFVMADMVLTLNGIFFLLFC